MHTAARRSTGGDRAVEVRLGRACGSRGGRRGQAGLRRGRVPISSSIAAKIRDRLAELKEQWGYPSETTTSVGPARRDQLRVALVGYTNAQGNRRSCVPQGSEVLVADKLFATLDTTVRALQPETKPRVLVSDTVGFIKKLPHDLVASFPIHACRGARSVGCCCSSSMRPIRRTNRSSR